jgi:hypothetical protein
MAKQYLKLLGKKVRDCVTGYEGIVTSMSFDLYGCVHGYVDKGYNEKDERHGNWFDHKRLIVLEDVPVMPQPSFAREVGTESGGFDKPAPPQ